MSAERCRIDLNLVAHHRARMKKQPKKLSRKPAAKKVLAKPIKSPVKSAKAKVAADGFVRISETRIRKTY